MNTKKTTKLANTSLLLMATCSIGCISKEGISTKPQEDTGSTKGHSLRIESPTVQLGIVMSSHNSYNHSFKIVNISDRDVIIKGSHAVTPCCSSIGRLPGRILPGEEIKVPVEFRPGFEDTGKRLVFRVETIPVRDSFELTVLANVRNAWNFSIMEGEPQRILLGTSKNLHVRVEHRSKDKNDEFTAGRIVLNQPLKLISLSEPTKTVEHDTGLYIESRIAEVNVPSKLSVGRYRSLVNCDNGKKTAYDHIISWQVIDRVTVVPPALAIGSKSDSSRKVFFTLNSVEDVQINEVRGYTLGWTDNVPLARAKNHRLEVELDLPRILNSKGGELVIQTDDPNQAEIKVPITVIPGP